MISSDSTSAGGAMPIRPVRDAILVGVMLAGLGTSALPAAEIVLRSPQPMQQTTAGASVIQVERAGDAIAELRRLSGLTWEQLARLFDVSRRSLHFWASGKAMTPANEEHLQRLLAVVRRIDRGSASATRADLLAVRDGAIAFDLRVVSALGIGAAQPRIAAQRLSEAATASRAPRPPDELVDALQNRVHRETGIARAAKSVRARSDR
jgi:transcriptional regulator with XRE-family HTH domain